MVVCQVAKKTQQAFCAVMTGCPVLSPLYGQCMLMPGKWLRFFSWRFASNPLLVRNELISDLLQLIVWLDQERYTIVMESGSICFLYFLFCLELYHIVSLKNDPSHISRSTCFSKMLLCPLRVEVIPLILEIGCILWLSQQIEYGGSDTAWLTRLSKNCYECIVHFKIVRNDKCLWDILNTLTYSLHIVFE